MSNTATIHAKREITIVIVDDDDVDAQAITRAMAQLKIANPIIRAVDGIDALEKLRSPDVHMPLIILLDLNMPRMGGIEFLEELRKDEKLHSALVIILTTSNAPEDISAAYEHYVAGYIVKSDVAKGFTDLINKLDTYWKIIELPLA